MQLRRRAAFVALSAVGVAAALGGSIDRSAAGDAHPRAASKPGRLVEFRSCSDLLGYVKAQATPLVGPWGFGGGGIPIGAREGGPIAVPAAGTPVASGAAPAQGVDYSGTNVHEEGVDEPDMVKTNGTTLFAVAGRKVNAVDVSKARPRLLDTLSLDTSWSNELLLHGDRLLVLSRGGYWVPPLPAASAAIAPYAPARSVLTEVDVSDPAHLRVVRTLTLDGAYVAARLVGGSARIVAASQLPGPLPFQPPAARTPEALAASSEQNRAVVASSGLANWLPSYRIAAPGRPAKTEHPLVQCRHVSRPAAFSGLGMLTVLTVDLGKGLEPVDSVAMMTDARIVYASPESLYVATERWSDRPDPVRPMQQQSGVSTTIHKFDISSPIRTRYRGSGAVSGYLLSQWSLSEYRGALRVVSTEAPAWWTAANESESFLTTLRQQDGALVQAGRIGGLGKGERVYAVRFVGDAGYVVTFRQTDPLYTLDLSDPEHPRVLGALTIPGFSAYLHPIGDHLLLGLGQDATEEGRLLGAQLSIFDVSDLAHPTRLYREALDGWSQAQSDYHAFLFWPRTGLVVIPLQQRAAAFRVGRARGIDDLGRIEHGTGRLGWTPTIQRSLVVGDSLLTISEAGVKSSSLTSLAELGWAAFPPLEPVAASG